MVNSSPSFLAQDGVFEARDHAASAQFQGETFSLAAVELFTVDGTDKSMVTRMPLAAATAVSVRWRAACAGCRSCFPGRILTVATGFSTLMLQTCNFELRINFESGGELRNPDLL